MGAHHGLAAAVVEGHHHHHRLQELPAQDGYSDTPFGSFTMISHQESSGKDKINIQYPFTSNNINTQKKENPSTVKYKSEFKSKETNTKKKENPSTVKYKFNFGSKETQTFYTHEERLCLEEEKEGKVRKKEDLNWKEDRNKESRLSEKIEYFEGKSDLKPYLRVPEPEAGHGALCTRPCSRAACCPSPSSSRSTGGRQTSSLEGSKGARGCAGGLQGADKSSTWRINITSLCENVKSKHAANYSRLGEIVRGGKTTRESSLENCLANENAENPPSLEACEGIGSTEHQQISPSPGIIQDQTNIPTRKFSFTRIEKVES